MKNKIDTLLMDDEKQEQARMKFAAHQQTVKKWFDKYKVGDKKFEVGDLVLTWDKFNEPKGGHSKFKNMWLGNFQVTEKNGVGTYHLQNLRGELEALPINDQYLKNLFS
jgi:hypothetical protein